MFTRLGVIGYELLSGKQTFPGPQIEDFRHQHLHENVTTLNGVPTALETLIDECLFKSPDTRPSPANVRARLDRLKKGVFLYGLAALQGVNQAEIRRVSEKE